MKKYSAIVFSIALALLAVSCEKKSDPVVVDIETITATNQTLISTLDEVMKIQEEGRIRRQNAEVELARIEGEMREKLLAMSRSTTNTQ